MRISDWSSDVCSSDLIDRVPLRAFSLMVPVVSLQIAFETEAHSHAAVVAGEKFDILCVFAVFESICSSAGARELSGLHINGRPLKTGSGAALQGRSCP